MNMTTVRKALAGAYIFKDKRDFSLVAQDCWDKVALAVEVSEVSQLSGLFPFQLYHNACYHQHSPQQLHLHSMVLGGSTVQTPCM